MVGRAVGIVKSVLQHKLRNNNNSISIYSKAVLEAQLLVNQRPVYASMLLSSEYLTPQMLVFGFRAPVCSLDREFSQTGDDQNLSTENFAFVVAENKNLYLKMFMEAVAPLLAMNSRRNLLSRYNSSELAEARFAIEKFRDQFFFVEILRILGDCVVVSRLQEKGKIAKVAFQNIYQL